MGRLDRNGSLSGSGPDGWPSAFYYPLTWWTRLLSLSLARVRGPLFLQRSWRRRRWRRAALLLQPVRCRSPVVVSVLARVRCVCAVSEGEVDVVLKPTHQIVAAFAREQLKIVEASGVRFRSPGPEECRILWLSGVL